MEFRKNRPSISEAKEKDMVTGLSQMRIEDVKISRNYYWYHSPLRNESAPSFKVNRVLNRWYDHSAGKGGNLIDIGVLLWSCSVSEVLHKMAGNFSLQQKQAKLFKIVSEQEAQIEISCTSGLSLPALFNCFQKHVIPSEIAHQFCCELRSELNGKTWFGIGFKNDLGVYEIRNDFHKLSNSPKGITSIKNGSNTIAVFEGFFDFISFMTIAGIKNLDKFDFIILNSLAFLDGGRDILDSYSQVLLFLDDDLNGKAATNLAQSWGNSYSAISRHYSNYSDVNDWLINASHDIAITLTDILSIKGKPPNLL